MIGKKASVSSAIVLLDPTAQVSVSGNSVDKITWHDGNPKKLTKKQILAKQAELQPEFDALQYQRSRQPEYPNSGDQLDALYHAGVFPDGMAAQLKAVKDKYPKP